MIIVSSRGYAQPAIFKASRPGAVSRKKRDENARQEMLIVYAYVATTWASGIVVSRKGVDS